MKLQLNVRLYANCIIESHTCKFYGFPHKIKKKEEYQRWIRLIR